MDGRVDLPPSLRPIGPRFPTELVMLENGGHFPVEHPAHEQLVTAFRRFVESAIASTQRMQ
jgi:hypothetical protein